MLTETQIRDIAAVYSKDPHYFEFEANDFIAAARAIEQASRTAALEEAAIAAWSAGMDEYGQYSQLMDPRHVGSVCAKRIRALAKGDGE